MQEFVAYRRICSSERGRPALQLEEQAAAILRFVQSRPGVLLQDFVELESGAGSKALQDRPQLREAMKLARKRGAVLVVSTLDRLTRDAAWLADLIASGVEFAAAETPDADAFMLQIHASVAQRQREQLARRVSASLQARKTKALQAGQPNPLGNGAALQPRNEQRRQAAQAFATRLAPRLLAWRSAGMSQRAMVEELNRQCVAAASGGTWSLMQLQRVLARLPAK